LGHTGVTTTTWSPGLTSACMANMRPLTPPEVTAIRSGVTGPWRWRMARVPRSSGHSPPW
jgi:hypothetical protein